ncbi:MAG: hypothetical protein H6Q59_932 [Firmicutes bacterium]|nr:hypothetical protein [Bacillota bacterium]
MMDRRSELPVEVVDLTSPGWNARLGRYFIGQTEELHFGNGLSAWGGIINPRYSGVNLYFDIFTITNFGDQNFDAEIWLNAIPPYHAMEGTRIVPSNQAITPPPRPKAAMWQAEYLNENLQNGTDIFGRIVTPNSTLVSDSHQGSIIIGQGGTFSILLRSSGQKIITATIVLTWWEERIGRS